MAGAANRTVAGVDHEIVVRHAARILNERASEEFDDLLAGLVGRLPVDLANLVAQHGVRRPAESTGIAGARIDLDHLERVAEPILERREPFAWRQPVFAEP